MVYVFKTSVSNESIAHMLKPKLDSVCEKSKWTFDLEDCDNILKVETTCNLRDKIIDLLVSNGFECKELE
ncbi:hypothetical protein [Abyssalbus ytuae]|uniref:HMA domain-containing protein n=1 Tax=Abyssalbus ytuae TaxID=2926907 RepID=A0A9E7D2A2_9FLAO|nr:hypothetical protein [Abyssalbus ytuae]UOB17948.1 hypothetical protein MQE35_01295 [Abyssalbus ytuae]